MNKNYDEYIKVMNKVKFKQKSNNINYWINKLHEKSNDVMIYTHNDMDGIFSGIAIKKYFRDKGFNIIGYGVIDYQEGWDVFKIDTTVINVVVDYAEIHPDMDIYIDHHGEFNEDITIKGAIKSKTGSAYEGIMNTLGLPNDSLVLDVIDMVDAAKYTSYGVKWTELMDFNLSEIIKKPNSKLLFAGVFNQLIKRGDFKTIIEVIHNVEEPSIYKVFNYMKKLYPDNNKITPRGKSEDDYTVEEWKKILGKDFVEDGTWRLEQVKVKTRGSASKKEVIINQKQFISLYTETVSYQKGKYAGQSANVLKMNGYCVIGEIAFVGSGTWANPIRARAIIQQDIESGRLPKEAEKIKWVILQYGDTLQICSYGNIDDYDVDDLPRTKEGKPIDNLKNYCDELLEKFKINLGFNNPNTASGGHIGIGNISNIGSMRFDVSPDDVKYNFLGLKYIDIFKNYMIFNLSKIGWSLDLSWENPFSNDYTEEPTPINAKVMMINQIRLINQYGDIVYPSDYEPKSSMKKMREEQEKIKEMETQTSGMNERQRMKYYASKHEYYKTHGEGDMVFDEWLKLKKSND